MTAALAIAATSEVLRFIIEDAAVRAGQALNFPPPPTTVGPLPRPMAQNGGQAPVEPTGVNLFLHHVTPNAAWRNRHAPERDGRGRRLNNAPLVMDLHYLLSAHGTDIDREIGFGTALHALHQAAIVPMPLVRKALTALAGNANPLRKILAGENLAEQIESLTITPETLDIDAVTKIWNAAQAPYRPSAGYLVTTVFLEDERPASPPLPVTAAVGIDMAALALVAIDSVTGLRDGVRAPLTAGARLDVRGRGFGAPDLAVTLDGAALAADATQSGPERLVLDLPANLAIGPHDLEVARLGQAGGHAARISAAVVSVTLLPRVEDARTLGVQANTADPARFDGIAELTLAPAVLRSDRVTLRLTEAATGTGIDFAWHAPTPAQHPDAHFTVIQIGFSRLAAGQYLVRVLVGGIASQPEPQPGGALGPRITL
jgi:hypothetical protein